MTDHPIELVLTVRLELPDELVQLLRRFAMSSTAAKRAATSLRYRDRPHLAAEKTWTEARKEMLLRLWPAGCPIGEIRMSLEQLPGPKLPNNTAIASYANGRLRVFRPTGFRRGSQRQSQSSPRTPR